MLFNHFISLFNAIKDNEVFFIKFSSNMESKMNKFGKSANVIVTKTSKMLCVKGIEYSKQKAVEEEIKNGKVLTNELPWGKWNDTYKNVIDHTRKDGTFHQYARMYFPQGTMQKFKDIVCDTKYFVNGVETPKSQLINSGWFVKGTFDKDAPNALTIDIEGVEEIMA